MPVCVIPQAAREDGSLIHNVRPFETLYSIAKVYDENLEEIILRNQLIDRGRVIIPGQELVIHGAGD